ncbi:MAG: hypothetical protein AB1798_06330 [Spirochaetota bacterium]
MSLFDLFRQEYVRGKVVDKYQLNNGNIGLIVEDLNASKRYHVEFKDNYEGPNTENLYGLLKNPFAAKTEPLNQLVEVGDTIDVTLSYSKGPFREAYQIHAVQRRPECKSPEKPFKLTYNFEKTPQY